MSNQHLDSKDDFHANLTPICDILIVILMGLDVLHKVRVPIAVIFTHLTLKWRLMNDILNIVKNGVVIVRVAKRPVNRVGDGISPN